MVKLKSVAWILAVSESSRKLPRADKRLITMKDKEATFNPGGTTM